MSNQPESLHVDHCLCLDYIRNPRINSSRPLDIAAYKR